MLNHLKINGNDLSDSSALGVLEFRNPRQWVYAKLEKQSLWLFWGRLKRLVCHSASRSEILACCVTSPHHQCFGFVGGLCRFVHDADGRAIVIPTGPAPTIRTGFVVDALLVIILNWPRSRHCPWD